MAAKYGFIHIGKTGGTAIKTALVAQLGPDGSAEIRAFGHSFGLRKIIRQDLADKVVFFIRDPVTRYISGFNSRLRKGAPLHYVEWNEGEAKAFARFSTANELAEALGSEDQATREDAVAAMQSIKHCKLSYTHYLTSVAFLEENRDRIAYIGAQESLDEDFAAVRRLFGLSEAAALPSDDVKAHRTPKSFDTGLSARGKAAIERYYAEDLAIYAWCQARRQELKAALEAN